MQIHAIIALSVFILALALIVSEKVHRTVVALAGSVILILAGVLTLEGALSYIDFNTLGVLVGMMIIVGIVKNTGVFEYLAIFSAKRAKGDPWKIIVSLCVITAVVSAILDNVTTVLLIVPMTFVITQKLRINPMLFLIPEAIASNIGGTATLIGDPPNIMIGSQAGLSFLDFIINDGPVVIVIFIATFLILKVAYRKKLFVDEDKKKLILELNEKVCIKDAKLLKKCIAVLALVIIGFFLHAQLGLESSVIALSGAVLLLLLSGAHIEDALSSVEWPVLFFFGGLFVMVGALQETGLIKMLADFVMGLSGGNLLLTGIVILWFSAIASAFIDNIPLVATLIPLILAMGADGINVAPLWWAISLGACLGGNGSLIGASANVVVAGLSEKHGHKITFAEFTKTGFPLMIVSIIISTVYLVIFYFK